MVVPAGGRELLGWAADGRRDLSRPEADLDERGLGTTVGDEGGFAPDLDSNEAALEALMAGIEAAGYEAGKDVFVAVDPATSELYADGATSSSTRAGRCRRPSWLTTGWDRERYPVLSLEDGMDEDDWDGGRRSPNGSASACSWSATTCS
jgi:enolase